MKQTKHETLPWDCIRSLVWVFVIKYMFNPVIVGLILYGEKEIGGEPGVRVAISISIITTSYLFLMSIGKFPWIGCYTNMLTKVYSMNICVRTVIIHIYNITTMWVLY